MKKEKIIPMTIHETDIGFFGVGINDDGIVISYGKTNYDIIKNISILCFLKLDNEINNISGKKTTFLSSRSKNESILKYLPIFHN